MDVHSEFIIIYAHLGETTVYFMFSRYKFGWDGAQTGIFMTYQNVIGFLGNVLAMGFLTQRLKLSDPLVGLCASISMVLSSLFYAMTESSHLMYFGIRKRKSEARFGSWNISCVSLSRSNPGDSRWSQHGRSQIHFVQDNTYWGTGKSELLPRMHWLYQPSPGWTNLLPHLHSNFSIFSWKLLLLVF